MSSAFPSGGLPAARLPADGSAAAVRAEASGSPDSAKRSAKRVPQTFMQAAASFEQSKIDELRLSRKLAWLVASVASAACLLALILAVVVAFLHKDPDPVLLAQDGLTGATTMLRPMKDATDKYGEVVDKYWLATYVRNREGYDWYTIGDKFEAVKLLSAPDVGTEYEHSVQAKNSPLNLLKDKAKIVPKVTSVAFTGDLAQVRFTTERQSMSGDNSDGAPIQNWIATIAYRYDTGLMTEQQRLVNPLGFKTVSYRVDPELSK